MKYLIRCIKSSYMLTAILYSLLGILMLIWPETITRIVCYGFGSLLIVYGLVQIIANFSNKEKTRFSGINTVNGLISSGIGLFFIVKYQILTDSIIFVMGLVIIIDSFIKFQKSIELQKNNDNLWWVGLLLTFLSIGLGVLVFINPFGTEGIARFVGTCLLIIGITDIWIICRHIKITACRETDGEVIITDTENKA